MQEPLHIISWGTASVLARRGKKPETIAVAYRTPILIEAVSSAETLIAARAPGADDLDPTVIRHLQGRLISPVSLSGGPVDREMLPAIALLTASLFRIPKPETPMGKLDDLRWRQILEDGEAEAVRLAAAKAAEFVLVDDILHRRTEAPVWTVALDRKGAVPTISLTVGSFQPPKSGHALRFPLSAREDAFAAAELIYSRLGTAQLVWPPPDRTAIEVTQPEVFAQAASRLTADDLHREVLALGQEPALAVLPPEMRRRWIAVRRLLQAALVDRRALLDELTGLALDAVGHRNQEAGFLGRLDGLLAVLAATPHFPAAGDRRCLNGTN